MNRSLIFNNYKKQKHMKKIWAAIKGFVLGIGANAAIEEGGEVVDKALDDFYEKNPEGCTALVKAVWAFVPFLQNMTAKTATPLDDKAVAEIKQELEEFAVQYNITL